MILSAKFYLKATFLFYLIKGCYMIVMFQLKGRDITEEERKMLEEEGVNIPYNVVLTKVRRPGLSNLSKNAGRSLWSLGSDSKNAT